MNYEAVSSRYINFAKSKLIGIRIKESLLQRCLGCLDVEKKGCQYYFGPPAICMEAFWKFMGSGGRKSGEMVVGLELKIPILGSRSMLIKVALAKLQYTSSLLFRYTVSVIKCLESLHCNFLWHGMEEKRKCCLIDILTGTIWQNIAKHVLHCTVSRLNTTPF